MGLNGAEWIEMVQDRVKVKVKLKQSLYKPGQVLRVAGS
jgi:hypothetical protein